MSKGKWIVAVGALLVVGCSFWLYNNGKRNKEPKYRVEKVERGDVTATVTATGTLAAVTTVKVGSQVSGIISKLYADFNKHVKKGELLAELDPTTFIAQADQRRADLDRAMAEARNARLSFERSKKLFEQQLLSQGEYDAARANYQGAGAAVKQSQAALKQAETNLSYTKILSPIDGIVVDRQYDIGQTVAASFQAPTLFTIAQDLTLMQVATNIDEADIGKIHPGEKATFNVDAFPDRNFEGKISQVRLSPQTVNNVVTYPVLIDVPNPQLDLKPGMTANVNVPTQTTTGVLKVPNAALRFKPDPNDLAERSQHSQQSQQRERHTQVVYTLDPEGKLKPIPVRASTTDGNFTAIDSDQLKEGTPIVVGLLTARAMDQTGGFQQRAPGGRRP
jgi:HlyD family secretion protein